MGFNSTLAQQRIPSVKDPTISITKPYVRFGFKLNNRLINNTYITERVFGDGT
jgi:hypothetical protein